MGAARFELGRVNDCECVRNTLYGIKYTENIKQIRHTTSEPLPCGPATTYLKNANIKEPDKTFVSISCDENSTPRDSQLQCRRSSETRHEAETERRSARGSSSQQPRHKHTVVAKAPILPSCLEADLVDCLDTAAQALPLHQPCTPMEHRMLSGRGAASLWAYFTKNL